MQKLYKRTDGVLHYHEAWASGRKVVEHWGVAGERGETKMHKMPKGADEDDAVAAVLAGAVADGYVPVDDIGEATLLVEFSIAGMGSRQDINKRHALEERLNETLGWTGLGHVDGGSSGSGTMEVCCYVADFEVARRVIAADLAGTEFADYTRIYNEDE